MDQTFFLGRPIDYWIELDERFKREQGLRAAELLEEVVTLRGKLAVCETRIQELAKLFGPRQQ